VGEIRGSWPKEAYSTILANARKYDAKAEFSGVQVQQMLAGGQEVISARSPIRRSASWSPLASAASLVEVRQGHYVPAPPATNEDALSMLDGIQAA